MTAGIDHRRRTLLAAAAALAAGAFPLSVAAQDPRSAEAQNAARDWLVLVDRMDATAAWDAAAAKFRSAVPADRWADALQKVRGPLGALQTRAVDTTRFAAALPGFPDGNYAVVVFRTSFANQEIARETVTLEREGTAAWRVVGYAIG